MLQSDDITPMLTCSSTEHDQDVEDRARQLFPSLNWPDSKASNDEHMGCGVPRHGVEPLVRAQFVEHPPSLIFWAHHPKKKGFGTLKNPPSHLIPQGTLIVGVVSGGGGGKVHF